MPIMINVRVEVGEFQWCLLLQTFFTGLQRRLAGYYLHLRWDETVKVLGRAMGNKSRMIIHI